MAEISIIVPVYKAEKYLNRCIDSLLAQTYTDFELILVDDGSPDNCGKICDDYAEKDSRVKVIHKENAGVSAARNSGIDVSSGKYIMFCDSDDTVEPDYLELMYTAAETDGTDIGVCGFRIILDDDEEKNQIISYNGTQLITVLGRSGFCDIIESNLFFSACNKIYNTEIIKKSGLHMNEEMKFSEDFHFNLEYFIKINGGVAVVGKPLYNYQVGKEDSSTKKYVENLWPITLTTFSLMKTLYGSLEDPSSEYKTRMYTRFVNMICSVLHNTMKKDNPQPFFKKFAENVRIVHSEEYKEAVTFCDSGALNPLYLKVLRTRSYLLIFMCEVLIHVKNRRSFQLK